MKRIVVIPARLRSARLPEKMLLSETGKTLIQHTYESASRAELPERVLVATDHERIYDAVTGFGGEAVMTSENAARGTDRVAEVAQKLEDVDIFVNVQGDEPEICGRDIDRAIRILEENPSAQMSTLATPITNKSKLEDPACVKVIFSNNKAINFSRRAFSEGNNWQHVGLYVYRREFLLSLAELEQPEIEKAESLEQLRVLWHGYKILVALTKSPSIGIDTRADYEAFVGRFRTLQGQSN